MIFKLSLKVIIVLLLFLIFGQTAIIPDLPGSFSLWKYSSCQESEDFSPDIYDCSKFYRCNNGYQTSFQVIFIFKI